MKKELNGKIILGVCIGVMLLICIIEVCRVNNSINTVNKYKAEIEQISNEKNKLVEDNEELSNDIKELHENIYNVFEKKPYEITIEHGDETITYSQDKFGLFDSYNKSIIY